MDQLSIRASEGKPMLTRHPLQEFRRSEMPVYFPKPQIAEASASNKLQEANGYTRQDSPPPMKQGSQFSQLLMNTTFTSGEAFSLASAPAGFEKEGSQSLSAIWLPAKLSEGR
jgi:hypothetical protein